MKRAFPSAAWRLAAALPLLGLASAAAADVAERPIDIRRAPAAIAVDGDLSDPGWRGVPAVTTWWETNPGDNLEPKVGNVAYLAYDDEFLYAGFEFADPEPEKIRAPVTDRDNVPSYTDYGGVILDARGDGKTAQMFLSNARGVQYDAINSDVTGENSSPDFHWDAAARITEGGWTLEMRIPFSSVRYDVNDEATWRVLLYRNHPRSFRYQIFSSRLPRDRGCFICNARPLAGLDGLPTGGSYVIAPYVAASQRAEPEDGVGTPLRSGNVEGEPGLDVKWIPNPDTVIDATLNPDFSQIESDVAQISTNERFALFFPEKRPFFLESVDLFDTPIQAVYTRSFTAPRWGARSTGKLGRNAYTLLVGEDRGGGTVILPRSNFSEFAAQDFASTVLLGRWRHDLGRRSFVSFLLSGREIEGGGSNRVFGPDFQWRPNDQNTVTGQLLLSRSETPNRPDLAGEWDGRELSGHGLEVWWWRGTETWDNFVEYREFADEFRADNGFVPQAGFRRGYGEVGRTWRPESHYLNRIRAFAMSEHTEDREGRLLSRFFTTGTGMNGKLNSFYRAWVVLGEVRSGERLFRRDQLHLIAEVSPSRAVSHLRLQARLGDEVDFANSRPGDGVSLDFAATLQPTDRLEMRWNATRRWLDVDPEGPAGGRDRGRLFTADVARLRATYNFSARTYLRLIGQYVATERDPELYAFEVERESAVLVSSALFAYKLNWQTVMFLGYGDERSLDVNDDLRPSGRQLFLKLSYAFQR